MAGELAKLNVKIGVDDSEAKSGMDRVTSSTKAQTKSITETLGGIGKSLNENLNTSATTNFSGGLDRLGSKFGVTRSAINGHVSGGFGLNNASAIGMTSINSISNGMTSMGKTVETSTSKSSGFLSGLGSAFKNMRDKADKSSSNGFGFGLHVGAGIQAITALTGSIGGIIKESSSASDAIDKFKQTLQFAGLDNKAIKRATADAKTYADQTVYGLDDITSTTAQLAANGIKNYTELTQASGNLNAVSGGNANTFKSVSMVLTQTAGAGKLTTENWNQLADAIPGASGKLQEAMRNNGAYTGNFRDAMEDGQISADEFNQALVQLGNTDVAKKAATSTATFEGAIGNLQAGIVTHMNQVIDSIGKENIANAVNELGNYLNNFIDFFTKAINFVKQNKAWLEPILAGIGGAIALFIAWNVATWALSTAMTILNIALSPMGLIFIGIAAAIAVIVAVIMNWGSISKWFGDLWTGIVQFIEGTIRDLGSIFTDVWNAIKQVTETVFNAVTQFLTNAWNQISWFIEGTIRDIGNVITDVWNGVKDVTSAIWNGIASFFSMIWDGIKAIFIGAITVIAVIIGTEINIIKATIEMVMNAISAIISAVWNAIGGTVMNVVNAISDFIKSVFDVISNVIRTVWDFIFNTIQASINNIYYHVMNVFNAVSNFIKSVFDVISNVATTAWEFIYNAVKTPITNIYNQVMVIFNAVSDFIKTTFDAIASTASSVWNNIKNFVSSAVDAIKNVVTNVLNAVKDFISGVFNAISSTASSVWNGIKEGVSNAVRGIQDIVSSVFNSVKSTVSGVWNGIKEAISGAMNSAKDVVSGVINTIKGLFSFRISWPKIPMPHFKINPSGWQIGDLLKGKIPSLGLDFYAKGGIMTAPTMFGVNGGNAMIGGEAGREAVLPLNRSTLGQIGEGILSATNNGAQEVSSQEINVTQNIYSHDTLTPREIERQARTEFEKYARDL